MCVYIYIYICIIQYITLCYNNLRGRVAAPPVRARGQRTLGAGRKLIISSSLYMARLLFMLLCFVDVLYGYYCYV